MSRGLPKSLMSLVGKGKISMKEAWERHKGTKSTGKVKRTSKRLYTKVVKTRSMASRRRKYYKRVRHVAKKIPLAATIGLLSGIAAPAGAGYGSPLAEALNGNWEYALRNLGVSYTFFDAGTGQFNFGAGNGVKAAVVGGLISKFVGGWPINANRRLGWMPIKI